MDEQQIIEQFNQKLDRLLQGQPPGRGKLAVEHRRALILARQAAQIDFSQESRLKEILRKRLAEQALFRLPHANRLSLAFLFKPGQLSWIGLVVFVQLVVGSIFGNMSAQVVLTPQPPAMACVTPPASSLLTQDPEGDSLLHMIQHSSGSGTRSTLLDPQPIPTPMAPLANTIAPHKTTARVEKPLTLEASGRP